jgi:hypothetical protein
MLLFVDSVCHTGRRVNCDFKSDGNEHNFIKKRQHCSTCCINNYNNKSQSTRKHKNRAMHELQLHLNYMKNKRGNRCNIC